MTAPIVECTGLWKSFGGKAVLRGLQLEVRRGETLVILGGSGSGKSVLLKHMNGLLRPDRGAVVVNGEDIAGLSEEDLAPIRRKIGMLFQMSALFDSMTVLENVAYPIREHRTVTEQAVRERVAELLEVVGLAGTGELAPAELSGGMRKRAGFARALVLDPAIVMFDEPDSGLDPVRTALLCELIREVHEENGGCYMVISHDLGTARRIADFIAVLWKGRIVESGPSDELFDSDNEFVNQFLNADIKGPLAMD